MAVIITTAIPGTLHLGRFGRERLAPTIPTLIVLGVLACSQAVAASSRQGPTPLPRLETPIQFDGRVDDTAWQTIEPLPMTMYAPIYRGDPTEHTEIFLTYDDDFLYAAGRFYDSDPERIRANSLYRDRWSGDDVFAMFVDSFNDNQSARRFTVNPAGVRIDELLGADGRERNLSWNGHWEVATSVDRDGWQFEVRVPFSSLRFQSTDDETVMGITVSRLIARKNERVTFPDIDPRFSFSQPSVTHDFLLTGVTPSRPVYVTPYILSGVDRSWRGDRSMGFATDRIGEVGADVKYSLGDNTFVDVSLNTDFAQVEADDQQINLTRFPLFFPEKRQFFQERSDLFLFDFGNGGRLFHSRRIGLSADRRPVRILGGVRLAGRAVDWDYGLLTMQSDGDLDGPAENFAVARIKRRAFNQYSHVGGVITSRLSDQHHSVAAGFDASIRLFGDHYTAFKWAGTQSDSREFRSLVHASQFSFDWERRADRGLRYWIKMNRAGPTYQPDVGFLPRSNFTHNSLYAVYNSQEREGNLLRSFGPGLILNTYFGNATGDLETLYLGHWWNYQLWNGAAGWLQVTHRFENVEQPFELDNDVFVLSGNHRFTNVWFNFSSGPGSLLRTTFDARMGTFYGGRQVEIQIAPTWNLSRYLELGAEYVGNYITFPDRGAKVNLHLARLRLRAASSVKFSLAALAQYSSVPDLIGVNVRLRYNVREGTDLWLVYDEGLNSERMLPNEPQRLPLSNSRAVRIKFTYTWLVGQ